MTKNNEKGEPRAEKYFFRDNPDQGAFTGDFTRIPNIHHPRVEDAKEGRANNNTESVVASAGGAGGGARSEKQETQMKDAGDKALQTERFDVRRKRIEDALEQIEKQGTGKSTDREKKGMLEKELEDIEQEIKRRKTTPSQETEKGGKEAWENEIKSLSSQEQETLGWNLTNVGYKIDAIKNKGFAAALSHVAETVDEKNKLHTFLQTWSEQFSKKQKQNEEHIQALSQNKGGATEQLKDKGVLAGNALKYGRLFADAANWTVVPLRGVMLGGMFTASAAEAAKETRLKNDSVVEKTRIEDMDKAAEEAWGIYEAAMNKAGKEKSGENKISAKELEQEYTKRIPADLLERLANNPEPGTGSSISQKILQWDMRKSVERMNRKLAQIDQDEALSAEQKESQKESYLQGFFTNRTAALKDFDRLLSQQGAVDTFGMYARYAEKGARAIVYAMMADSIYRLGSSLAETLSYVSEKDIALERMLEDETTTDTQEGATPQAGSLQPEPPAEEKAADSGDPTEGRSTMYPGMREDMATQTSSLPPEIGAEQVASPSSDQEGGPAQAGSLSPETPLPAENGFAVTIGSGDSLWNAIENKLETQDVLSGMNEAQRTYAIDAIKDRFAEMSSQELKDIGISSGNIDQIKAGEVIDLSSVMERAGLMEQVTEQARGLNAEQIENITQNNEALQAYVENHPNEPLTSEKVEEILRKDLERTYEANEQGKSATPVEQPAAPAEEAPGPETTQPETNSATLEARIESKLNSVLGIENALASDTWKQLQGIEVQTIRELEVPEGGFTGEAAPLGPMQEYLEQLIEKTRTTPELNESVESFLRRAVPKTM